MWLNPETGEVHSTRGEVLLLPYVDFYCERHQKWEHLETWRQHVAGARGKEHRVALFYQKHWRDCELPTLAPSQREWGFIWRELLGWLYGMGATREGVLFAWSVFRRDRLKWLENKTSLGVALYGVSPSVNLDVHLEQIRIDGRGELVEVLHIQNALIPVEDSWVVDERREDVALVYVEGFMHDETLPLMLVVHVPQDRVIPSETYVVGCDRHTKVLFALRVPAQFRYLDSALRWTVSAEPWDEIIEV